MANLQRQYGILHGHRSQLGSESRLHTDVHCHSRRTRSIALNGTNAGIRSSSGVYNMS